MHGVYKLKDMLCEELEEYGKKEQVSMNDLEVIDKLAHSIKNIDKVLEEYEEEERGYSHGWPKDGREIYYDDDRYDVRRMSYARDGRGMRRSTDGRRGGRMGGYSMADESMKDMLHEMKELADDMPEEKRMEMQKFIRKMEQM